VLHALTAWGGFIGRSSAHAVQYELARLRDVRYVLPSLEAADARHRALAVTCLAFLTWVPPGAGAEGGEPSRVGGGVPRDDVLQTLRAHAVFDPAPGVRRAALWAYGLAGAASAETLLSERADDEASIVRDFVRQAVARLARDRGAPDLIGPWGRL
jgi:hypothetical protein